MISPAGESKATTVFEFYNYINSGGYVRAMKNDIGYQSANGLVFDPSWIGATDNDRVYVEVDADDALGTEFSIFVSAYVPPEYPIAGGERIFFGVGPNNTPVETNNAAYIGISGNDLVAYVQGTGVGFSRLTVPGFFPNGDQVFYAGITKNLAGNVNFYVDGILITGSVGLTDPVNNNTILMGNGVNGGQNIGCTIFEAHIFDREMTATEVDKIFWAGVDTFQGSLLNSYIPTNLNPGPTQWLDRVSGYHLLLPNGGAQASAPDNRFLLNFYVTGSGYIGNGTNRNVLPVGYFLKSCIVDSPFQPTMSIGSNATEFDSRAEMISSSYNVTSLGLSYLGNALPDRSIYVQFSGSGAPCAISFDGYIISNYNIFVPPNPTPTQTPSQTPTPTTTPSYPAFTPTPSTTATSTPTPTPTSTPTPTPTPSPGASATPTPTPVTATPTPTPTTTPTPTPFVCEEYAFTSSGDIGGGQYWISASAQDCNGNPWYAASYTAGVWSFGPLCLRQGSVSVYYGSVTDDGLCPFTTPTPTPTPTPS
jgi:hypothetical protein